MSSDQRPAKVRVVSTAPAQDVPARRRGDVVDDAQAALAAVGRPGGREGASLLWMIGALVLFLAGCAVGGALFVLSGVASAGQL